MRGYQVTGGTGQQLKSPARHILTGMVKLCLSNLHRIQGIQPKLSKSPEHWGSLAASPNAVVICHFSSEPKGFNHHQLRKWLREGPKIFPKVTHTPEYAFCDQGTSHTKDPATTTAHA